MALFHYLQARTTSGIVEVQKVRIGRRRFPVREFSTGCTRVEFTEAQAVGAAESPASAMRGSVIGHAKADSAGSDVARWTSFPPVGGDVIIRADSATSKLMASDQAFQPQLRDQQRDGSVVWDGWRHSPRHRRNTRTCW